MRRNSPARTAAEDRGNAGSERTGGGPMADDWKNAPANGENIEPVCIDSYEALLAEARLAAANGASVDGRSFYIGGGTPTCTGDGPGGNSFRADEISAAASSISSSRMCRAVSSPDDAASKTRSA